MEVFVIKKVIKRILVTTMSAASIFGVAFYTLADEVSQPTTHVSIEEGNVTNVIAPRASTKPVSINFTGERTNDMQMFVTSLTVPWAKVKAHNTGTTNMIITITKGSPSGRVVSMLILTPGQTDNTWGILRPGTYYVNFTSTGYLKGSASCLIASTYDELGFKNSSPKKP